MIAIPQAISKALIHGGCGFVGGCAIAICYAASLAIWDTVSQEGIKSADISTLVAGVVGSVVGGGLSWLISRQAANETLRRDAIDREALLEVAALRTLMKLQRLGNGYHTHKVYFWRQLEEAHDAGNLWLPMWNKVKTQVGSDVTGISFNSDDFVPLLAVGKVGLINECGLLAERYTVVERSIVEYNRQRKDIEELLADYTTVRADGLFITNIPLALRNRVEVKTTVIENFVRAIYSDIMVDEKKARALCEEVSAAFVAYFKDEAKFRLVFTDE